MNKRQFSHLFYRPSMALMLASCVAVTWSCEQESKGENPIVPNGYHSGITRLSDEEKSKLWNLLNNLPAELPENSPLELGYLIQHVNKRLVESGTDYQVVVESDLPDKELRERYFGRRVQSISGKPIGGQPLGKAIVESRMFEETGPPNCGELLKVIESSADASLIFRKGNIILSGKVL